MPRVNLFTVDLLLTVAALSARMKYSSASVSSAITALVRGTCYYPNDLKVEGSTTEAVVDLVFLPHMRDLPLLIGKSGHTVNALRFIGRAIEEKTGIIVTVEYAESWIGRNSPWEPAKQNPHFVIKSFTDVFNPLAELIFGFVPPYDVRESIPTACVNPPKTNIRLDVGPADSDIVRALCDVFYPFGMRQGRKIQIRSQWTIAEAVAANH